MSAQLPEPSHRLCVIVAELPSSVADWLEGEASRVRCSPSDVCVTLLTQGVAHLRECAAERVRRAELRAEFERAAAVVGVACPEGISNTFRNVSN